jgi:hypothetical protein
VNLNRLSRRRQSTKRRCCSCEKLGPRRFFIASSTSADRRTCRRCLRKLCARAVGPNHGFQECSNVGQAWQPHDLRGHSYPSGATPGLPGRRARRTYRCVHLRAKRSCERQRWHLGWSFSVVQPMPPAGEDVRDVLTGHLALLGQHHKDPGCLGPDAPIGLKFAPAFSARNVPCRTR